MNDIMDLLEIRIAILRTGKRHYQIAQEIGVTETRFSGFLQGRRQLPPEAVTRLQEMLGLVSVGEEAS
jgi:plasmid maintenance system antidote protein VapI